VVESKVLCIMSTVKQQAQHHSQTWTVSVVCDRFVVGYLMHACKYSVGQPVGQLVNCLGLTTPFLWKIIPTVGGTCTLYEAQSYILLYTALYSTQGSSSLGLRRYIYLAQLHCTLLHSSTVHQTLKQHWQTLFSK